MAVFTAYLDASGASSDPNIRVLTVAGFIAPDDAWARFEAEWQEALKIHEVSELHMKDFAHSLGEFEEWKGDEKRRTRFLGDLSRIIGKHTHDVFAHSFLLDHYRVADKTYQLSEFAKPYPLAAQFVVGDVQRWMRENHPDDDLIIVFEKGDEDQGNLTGILSSWGHALRSDPVFKRKKWIDDGGIIRRCVPLQASDFIAYEDSKMLTDYFTKGRTTARGSLFAILRDTQSINKRFKVLGYPFFKLTCEALKIPRRSVTK